MARVVLIEDPELLDSPIELDMRRWWGDRVRKHVVDGEVYFEVGAPVEFRTREGVKRLASFGVPARVANRKIRLCL
ncbi:hypothetical protein LCGC14_1935350 [marine sediment metagenome]|uniref:Uncharacterized protein n=1 Tax=marine sediment metagenome TaxID=412755 RepID=A0A0F9FMB8_9ZZZZ